MKTPTESTAPRRLSIQPLLYRLRQRLTSVPTMEQACVDKQIICPEETRETPPAIYLPDQMAHVQSAQEETNMQQETDRIRGGLVMDEATVAYRFEGGVMLNGIVYAGGHRTVQVFERENWLPRVAMPLIAQAALPATMTGSQYFGHFISDDACTAVLGAQFAPVFFAQGHLSTSPHVLQYLALYGISANFIRSAQFQNLWLFKDYGMNSHKRQRLMGMRDQVRQLPSARSGHGVYFRRRGAGQIRHPVNEAQVEERLVQEGFEIIDVTVDTVETIIKRTKDAAVVVGVEGSALVHGLMSMANQSLLLCLQPPQRFNNILKAHADAMGMRYGFTVGEPLGSEYQINADDILRTIDLAKV